MIQEDSLTSDQLIALTRSTHELTSTLNRSQVISLVLANAAEFSGCPGICLVLFNELPGQHPEVYPHGLSQNFAQSIPGISYDLTAGKDLMDQGYQTLDDLPGTREEGIRSAICFPLVAGGSMKGLLYFFHFEDPSLPGKRRQGLRMFSNYVATAIENAHLYEEKERKIRQLNILNEATVSLSSESDTQALFQKLADHVLFLLRPQAALLILLQPGSHGIEQVFVSGDLVKDSLGLQGQITGIFSEMLTTHDLLNLQAEELEVRSIDLPFSVPDLGSLLAIPMIHQQIPIGILVVINKSNGRTFDKEDEDLLLTYGFQAALSVENARLHERTKRLAITDGLTDLFNHREFQHRLQTEIRRSLRYKRSFSLLMIDIDYFKNFNDTYGHPVGDKVLKGVAHTIRESIRDIDIPARYGGEEFMVILPETSSEHAQIVAERIRGKVFEKSFGSSLANETFFITVSVGISCFPKDTLRREDLVTKCDQALYFAKREGRNRVRRYDETLKSFIERKQEHIGEILKDAKVKVMRDLAAAVDAKNLFTRGHTDEVIHYAVAVAKALKLPPSEIESVRLAGILHDIGTVSVPEEILNKPGPLTAEERRIIQGHPQLGEMILQKASRLENIIPAILYHHERYDGKGYPNGLQGKDIPLLARILGIVEAYQAMISDRPYRQRLSKEDAVEELRKNAGKQFDPELVDIFVEIIQ